MTDLYTSTGKQVLRNGEHFGEAVDEESAGLIVAALNGKVQSPVFLDTELDGGLPPRITSETLVIAAYLDAEADKTPRARVRARTLRIAASNVRAGLWREG